VISNSYGISRNNPIHRQTRRVVLKSEEGLINVFAGAFISFRTYKCLPTFMTVHQIYYCFGRFVIRSSVSARTRDIYRKYPTFREDKPLYYLHSHSHSHQHPIPQVLPPDLNNNVFLICADGKKKMLMIGIHSKERL
jgi:hypothetical protein